MVFWRKLTRCRREQSKTKLLQNQTLTTHNPRKQTKNKAARGGRVATVSKSGVVDSPGEQEVTSATSREGWSHAEMFSEYLTLIVM